MESGEQPDQTLRRELREEVGLEITDLRVFTARSFAKSRQVEIVFTCRCSGDAKPISVEVERAVWFRSDTLPEALGRDQKRLIEAALANGANRRD